MYLMTSRLNKLVYSTVKLNLATLLVSKQVMAVADNAGRRRLEYSL